MTKIKNEKHARKQRKKIKKNREMNNGGKNHKWAQHYAPKRKRITS